MFARPVTLILVPRKYDQCLYLCLFNPFELSIRGTETLQLKESWIQPPRIFPEVEMQTKEVYVIAGHFQVSSMNP